MPKLNAQQIVSGVEAQFLKKEIPPVRIGDNVKVGVKIIEGNKERVQFYEGTVIAKKIVQLIQLLRYEKFYKVSELNEFS